MSAKSSGTSRWKNSITKRSWSGPDLVYHRVDHAWSRSRPSRRLGGALAAPLRSPARAVKTPNPPRPRGTSLGLQELLVYYDPGWQASFCRCGNQRLDGNSVSGISIKKGTATTRSPQRQFAYLTFQIGFFVLWIILIIMGTSCADPTGTSSVHEPWDAHKVEVLNNSTCRNTSGSILGKPPVAPEGSSDLAKSAVPCSASCQAFCC